MFRTIFAVISIITYFGTLISGEVYSECDGEPQHSYVAVASNCSEAIYCDGTDSTIVGCDDKKPYFSPADGMCYDNFSVCGNRVFSLETTSIPTTPLTSTAASNIATTSGTTATLSSIATLPNTSNNTTTSSVETAPASAITTTVLSSDASSPETTVATTENTSTANHPSIISQCPYVDDPRKPLFLPHPKSCSKYYLCYHGVATLMQCPNRLHFDVSQQTCNTAARAKCRLNSTKPRDQCLPYIVKFYPHPTNCNYYYLCEYGFLMVMQCPFNMEWDFERNICTMKSKAKCYNVFAN